MWAVVTQLGVCHELCTRKRTKTWSRSHQPKQGRSHAYLPVQSLRTKPAMIDPVYSSPSDADNLTTLDTDIHAASIAA